MLKKLDLSHECASRRSERFNNQSQNWGCLLICVYIYIYRERECTPRPRPAKYPNKNCKSSTITGFVTPFYGYVSIYTGLLTMARNQFSIVCRISPDMGGISRGLWHWVWTMNYCLSWGSNWLTEAIKLMA